ncbi:MAG: type II toxin-antitoxin system PemK/MazF family toxin [Acidobacteriaceae bacterium]
MAIYPKRGEVFWVSFDPSVGGEVQKTRPAIILSNDAANAVLNRLIVLPLSSKTDRLYPGEVLVRINQRTSKAMSDQLTTISKLRLQKRITEISEEEMTNVEKAVLLQLGIRH